MKPRWVRNILGSIGWGVGIVGGVALIANLLASPTRIALETRNRLDSLDRLLDLARRVNSSDSLPVGGGWPLLSQSSIDSIADSLQLDLQKSTSSPLGRDSMLFAIELEGAFPSVVLALDRMEPPYRSCLVRRWNMAPLDPAGGEIKASLELACQGGGE